MATNSGCKAYIAVDPEVLFCLSVMSSAILASLAEPFASNGDVQELFCAVRIASENFHVGDSAINNDSGFIPSCIGALLGLSPCSSPTPHPSGYSGGSVARDVDPFNLDSGLK